MPSLASSQGYQPPPQPPFPPGPGIEPGLPEVHVSPPLVYVEPRFEYKQLAREITGGPPVNDAELDELGRGGWELVSVLSDGRTAYFYFKRVAQ